MAIFSLKYIEIAEFRNKIEIDESERCYILKPKNVIKSKSHHSTPYATHTVTNQNEPKYHTYEGKYTNDPNLHFWYKLSSSGCIT